MRKGILFLGLTVFSISLVIWGRFLTLHAFGQSSQSQSATKQAPSGDPNSDSYALSAMEQLGKDIFFDKRLSNPPGVACVSCHTPEAGYAGSNDSEINKVFGVGMGAVSGRCESRNPPTISYSRFCPNGPPVFDRGLQAYVGGFFLDGRMRDLKTQVQSPFYHPNEMNNNINNAPAPQLIVDKIRNGPYAENFRQVFGTNVFEQTPQIIVSQIAEAIVAFESSKEISPFTSKYDAYLAGKAQFSPSEMSGFELVTGFEIGRPGMRLHKSAQCAVCHGIQIEHDKGPDLWTQFCYENIGVPKNLNNPYYVETNKESNPKGYNTVGMSHIDLGLGDFLYPEKGLPAGNLGTNGDGKGDFLFVNGAFKVPTLRNVDKRPNPNFVKAYMHNGYFKTLKDVVHFYNTRNLTSAPGEVIDFTSEHPYVGLKGQPKWPAPESFPSATLVNPTGQPGQLGNLGLTESEEGDIVAFLKTLSDGYTKP